MQITKANLNWRGPLTPITRKIERIICHHPAGGTLQSNHRFHRDTRGWTGLGYSYWIELNGTIYEVRGRNIGAHSGARWNEISYGICFEGNFETQLMTDAQLASGVWLCAKLCREENLTARDIVGHGTRFGGTSNTLCPGKNFRMAELKAGTEEALKPEPAPKPAAGKFYRVQVGAFRDRVNAQRLVQQLKEKGFEAFIREEVER